MRRGYAVLDFETTGLSPKRGDRVLEVGVVYMDPDLMIDGGIETLINPQRDVGPTHVHGVTARDVFDAPTFDQVAPSIIDMLDGRVLVGHNVSFDLRFLVAELEREGYEVPDVVAIDTLQIARTLFKSSPPSSFKLHDLAEHLGFGIEDVFARVGLEQRPEHSAFGDALVTAYLLSHLAQESSTSAYWDSHLDSAERTEWPERYVSSSLAAKRRGDPVVSPPPQSVPQRSSVMPSVETPEYASVSGSVGDVFRALGAKAPDVDSTAHYAKVLDEAVHDRVLDSEEVDALVDAARALGLDTVTLGSLHRGHFDGVVREAWSDGVLTPEEREDIARLAALLGIDDDSLQLAFSPTRSASPEIAAPASPSPAQSETDEFSTVAVPAGSVVVLTGTMMIERDEIVSRLIELGFVIGVGVTKRTALVIAADPYTQSGKAKKARSYGIPVVGEAEGLGLLNY